MTVTPRAPRPTLTRPVAVGTSIDAPSVRLSADPDAPIIGVADPERVYPFRLKEFLTNVNQRLRALGAKAANPYDIRAVIAVHGKDQQWLWEPQYGPKRYSGLFAEWLVAQAAKDKFLLRRARAKWKRMARYP